MTPSRVGATGPVPALLALGLAWALLSAWMQHDGAVARAVWVPIDPTRYYGVQALFVAPWLAALGSAFAAIAHLVGRALGGRSTLRETWAGLVPRWAWPSLLLFVLPDLAVALVFGREHLPRAMRTYGLLAPLVVVWLTSGRLATLQGLGRGRATVAVVVALLTQVALAAVLLR